MYVQKIATVHNERRPARRSGSEAPVLAIKNVTIKFGGIVALDGVSFDIHDGEVLGLIGPNGAGKTTLFNCLSRLYQPSDGKILMNGQDILARPAHKIAEIGIGRTFQNVALFHRLSVLDNVRVGTHCRTNGNFLTDGFRSSSFRPTTSESDREVLAALEDLELIDVMDAVVSDLPFGTQKRVELARALASRPKLLLLDEPAGGLNHEEVYVLGDLIRRIRDERNLTVLLVEHHMGLVMSIADHVVTLNFGKLLAEGTTSEIQANPEVIKAYLGGSAA
jgi:branched-chain amino acid transport system ATP-binding protein